MLEWLSKWKGDIGNMSCSIMCQGFLKSLTFYQYYLHFDQMHFDTSSLFCVVSSWASFLINPQVNKNIITLKNILRCFSSLIDLSDCPWKNGTSGDIVSLAYCSSGFHNNLLPRGKYPLQLFLSAMIVTPLGFWGYNSPCLLGSCPLLFHLWGNSCLHVPTDLDPDGRGWGWSEGCWTRDSHKSLEDW